MAAVSSVASSGLWLPLQASFSRFSLKADFQPHLRAVVDGGVSYQAVIAGA